MSLTAEIKARVEPEDKAWVSQHAAKLDRTEGAVVRIALREYRANIETKGEKP